MLLPVTAPAARGRDPRPLLAAAVVLPGLAVVEGWVEASYRAHPDGVAAAAVALLLAALVAVRSPTAGAVVAALSFPAGLVLGLPGLAGTSLVGTVLALAHAGWADPVRRSATGLGAAVATFVVTGVPAGGSPWDALFLAAVLVPSWWLGVLVRHAQGRARELARLAAALDAERERSARAAVIAERTRIARDVHDAVAHSVSVMTLQVGGLRRQLDDVLRERPAEREVMLGLEELGRRSVDDLRALVGILRQPSEAGDAGPGPTPSLAHLDDLVRHVRAAGLDVRLRVDGDPGEPPPGLDVSAYRVVQEALTNVLRHAPGARCEVVLTWRPDSVSVDVHDDGGGAGGAGGAGGRVEDRSDVGGHGLVGMRERVGAYGGTLAAGPESGGFRVVARFPVSRHR